MWLVWVCTINILGCLAHFELYSLSSVLDLQRLQRFNLVRWPLVLFPPPTRCFSGWQHFITSCYRDGFGAPIFFTHASSWHNFSASRWCCDNVSGMVSMKSAHAINFDAPNLSMSHKNSPKYPRIGGGARSWRQQKFIWSCLRHVCRSPDQPN